MPEYLIAKVYDWGCVHNVELESTGLLRINGWTTGDLEGFSGLRTLIDGREASLMACYRTYLPHVAKAIGSENPFRGIAFEYLLQPRSGSGALNVQINIDSERIFDLYEQIPIVVPDYPALFSLPVVLHRDDIYCFGPPITQPPPEVIALATSVADPVLDFGCGTGALIRELRGRGLDAIGIELNREAIIENLLDDVEPYVKLYDGILPLPFDNGSFESVVCFEVLEHITDYEDMLAELARVTRSNLLVSVPDMSAIPICHPHNVVPWHLLESTHHNFFTQTSLTLLLQRYFREIGILRISPSIVNETRFYGSLVGICRK